MADNVLMIACSNDTTNYTNKDKIMYRFDLSIIVAPVSWSLSQPTWTARCLNFDLHSEGFGKYEVLSKITDYISAYLDGLEGQEDSDLDSTPSDHIYWDMYYKSDDSDLGPSKLLLETVHKNIKVESVKVRESTVSIE